MLAYTGMGTWARRRWSPRPSRRAASATGTATPIDGITLSAGILGENARRAAVRRGERPLSAHGLRRADQVDLAPRCPAGAWDTTGHAAVGAELAKAAEPVISRLLGEQPCSREYSSMTWTILHCRRVSTWSGSVRPGGSALFIIRPPPQWSLPACDADRRSAGRPRRARARLPAPKRFPVPRPLPGGTAMSGSSRQRTRRPAGWSWRRAGRCPRAMAGTCITWAPGQLATLAVQSVHRVVPQRLAVHGLRVGRAINAMASSWPSAAS